MDLLREDVYKKYTVTVRKAIAAVCSDSSVPSSDLNSLLMPSRNAAVVQLTPDAADW